MFGDNNAGPAQDNNAQSAPVNNPALPPADNGISSFTMDSPGQPAPSTQDNPAVSIPPGEPTSAPLPSEPQTNEPPAHDSPVSAQDSTNDSSPKSDNDLLSIKQQALTQLSPMLDHLDQTPEEKFRTTMMMIQANDDQSLIKDAYEAAQQITDEKVKAQALLDVVNEINYFTHNNED